MTDILFVNHRSSECGVQQFGSRYYRNLAESKKYACHYIDVETQGEVEHWFNVIQPAAIVWNFYSGATMPWCSGELIGHYQTKSRQLAIYHELDLSDKPFDLVLHQDPNPSEKDDFPHWSLPRSIPRYENHVALGEIPRFGSFGFGLGGKGFDDVVKRVCAEYDEAHIHLHIPYAHFGDANGESARAHAANARQAWIASGKSRVTLEIDHEFWQEEVLLDWLAHNTCNCFFYHEHYGRGISGTLDYALAVERPLAITHSWQFRHVWGIDDSFCVDGDHPKTLHDIIAMGTAPTDKFREMWSREAFVASFEAALESIGVMP